MSALNKILIVDDESHVRLYITMLINQTFPRVEVVEAGSGEQGLAMLSSAKPDLVLLDINMIGSNGLQTLHDMKQTEVDCRIVMLTSVDVRASVEQALNEGADGYILKDKSYEELAEILQGLARKFFETDSNETTDSPE